MKTPGNQTDLIKTKPKSFTIHELSIKPIDIKLYIPPIVWKGDCIGHIGVNDIFFWVLEGECFLNIDSHPFIARPGQLAYLPKGKMRSYTHSSTNFSMYEIAFSAEVNGQDLMEVLGLTDSDFVVDIPQKEEMTKAFESSSHVEMFRNPIYDIGWCANIINIIKLYVEARQKQDNSDSHVFDPVLAHMAENLGTPLTTESLASLVYMQPTYFIRRFKASYGLPPIAYLGQLRLQKAMELLSTTGLSMEKISRAIGIEDTSYFARFFKKNCGVTPSEYRNAFRR